MSDIENHYDRTVSAGGIVMIVIASVGVLTAVTTIACLFVTSKKRSRVNARLESITTRTTHSPHRNGPRSPNEINLPVPRMIFPDLDELAKRPPTYDEAMRLPSPVTPNAPQLPEPSPSGTPPPAFDEVSVHETPETENIRQQATTAVNPVITGTVIKINNSEPVATDTDSTSGNPPNRMAVNGSSAEEPK
uniref:Uncharacterized protein n=1 Tax=Panagrolaimus sp. JU765 TaxID=591449 RepID=A0AC34RI59_9BILA